MKHRSPLFITITLAIAGAFAFAPIAMANHSWNGYHWARTANPFTLKLGDNVSSAWDSVLNTTATDWSKSDVLDTTVVAGGVNNIRRCSPTPGQVEVCNTTYGNTGWLGVAQIWVSSSHITQGTVKLNDTYFNTTKYNTTAWRNLVSCQEVGHTLGLDHQDTNFNNANLGTCMDYTNDPSTNQHPNQHDYDELDIIYAHLDSFTTLGQTVTKHGNGQTAETPAAWGLEIHRSADGHVSDYALDLGHGHQILTHVIWAE